MTVFITVSSAEIFHLIISLMLLRAEFGYSVKKCQFLGNISLISSYSDADNRPWWQPYDHTFTWCWAFKWLAFKDQCIS